jgi:hypothetical protein
MLTTANYLLWPVKPALSRIRGEIIKRALASYWQSIFHHQKLKAMKKVLLAAAITLFTGLVYSAKAGDLTNRKESKKQLRKEKREKRREEWLHSASRATEDQFYQDFPGASNISWNEAAFAEATFNDGTGLKTAYYDFDNELVGTTAEVDISMLPAGVKEYIAKKYPGYSIEKVILFDDNEANETDMFLFDSSFSDEDTYFPLLTNGTDKIILKVNADGAVSFFKELN